jgi:hypothetical protein
MRTSLAVQRLERSPVRLPRTGSTIERLQLAEDEMQAIETVLASGPAA